jgi:hypothetical protein
MKDERILAFYAGTAPDDRGRSLADVQSMTDEELERVHDYIQWLFPLRERSGANPWAPVLDEPTIAAFLERPELRDRLRQSFTRMLAFYGLSMTERGVQRNETFDARSKVWLSPGNHNHLRLTRMIRSLRTLGLEPEAQALFSCLQSIYEKNASRVTPTTFRFWKEAASS